MIMANQPIPGTIIFDGREAVKGYGLNKMCLSFNSAANRNQFKKNEAAYCRNFDLTEPQLKAVIDRDVVALLELGGNIYYLAKLFGIFGLNVQDIGAQQTGLTVDAFRTRLLTERS